MYEIRKDVDIKINKTLASETIGVSREYLTQVINGKELCSKLLAYCITKYLDENAEILDYFIRKED